MQFQFAIPKCICESGASQKIGQMITESGCQKILCIYDGGVKAAGIVDPLLLTMWKEGIEVHEFDGVVPDPSVDVVEKAGKEARNCGADGIVAIGGGSAIDTAKMASVLATNSSPLRQFYNRGVISVPPLPLFVIPTTSGTGSEVTPAAVVSDPELGRKITLVDSKLIPLCAVLDPALTLTLPGSLTAATGMDALSHAVESMTCILHNPMTDGIALSAIRLITGSLPICVRNGDDENARTNMMIGATMAGMAFGNTAAHVGHAFAHAMGARWHIAHGAACALALPFAINNCFPAAREQILSISEAVGIADATLSPEKQAEKLAKWFREFASSLGIPTLQEWGIAPTELEDIVEATMKEKPLIQLSGVPVTEQACRAYYEELFKQ